VLVFFSNLGVAYSLRLHDLALTPRGFGDPIQKLFSFNDGERVIAAFCLDAQIGEQIRSENPETPPPLHLMVATNEGRGFRLSLESFSEPSTRSGRRFARPSEGFEVVSVQLCRGSETLLCLSQQGRHLLFAIEEVSYLTGAAKGVTLMKLELGDRMLTAMVCNADDSGLWVARADGGKPMFVSAGQTPMIARGGKGNSLIKRGQLVLVNPEKKVSDEQS
jgi:DNA gyrase subunit A